jgi:ABC-type nitrate/sulfonate/bicarbonate transport system permease component
MSVEKSSMINAAKLHPSDLAEKLVTASPKAKRPEFWRSGRYLGPLAIILYLGAWFAITSEGFALVKPIKFPSPLMVLEAAVRMNDLLLTDAMATLGRVLFGLVVGSFSGLVLGLLMSYNKKVLYFFDPLVESMRPVPVIAMIPFFLMWFGINEPGKLLLITLGVFTIAVVNTVEAVRNVPYKYLLAAQSLGASHLQRFRTIVIPAIVPDLIGPLRVAVALSFTLGVAAEFMGADEGIGYRILEARRLFRPDVILLGVTMIGILAGVVDALTRKITTYVTRWSDRSGR